MVGLMSNSLGTTTRVIQMTQLTDEMRNAMSMLSRDARRANYSAHAIYCYANADCGTDGTTTLADVVISASNGDSCLTFNVDRDQDNYTANARPGGFRRSVRASDGAGFIEMWVGGTTGFGCGSGSDWFALTDPDFVDITWFNITPTQYEESVPDEGGSTVHQRTTQVRIHMIGSLRLEPTIVREIEDTIRIRNDVVWRTTT
jgi:hypothetical protein